MSRIQVIIQKNKPEILKDVEIILISNVLGS